MVAFLSETLIQGEAAFLVKNDESFNHGFCYLNVRAKR